MKTCDDANRLDIEDTLKLFCHPLSLGPKYADLFLMKVLISITIAGQIIVDIERSTAKNMIEYDNSMGNTMNKCMVSWFKRYKSSTAMIMGTDNESQLSTQFRRNNV